MSNDRLKSVSKAQVEFTVEIPTQVPSPGPFPYLDFGAKILLAMPTLRAECAHPVNCALWIEGALGGLAFGRTTFQRQHA